MHTMTRTWFRGVGILVLTFVGSVGARGQSADAPGSAPAEKTGQAPELSIGEVPSNALPISVSTNEWYGQRSPVGSGFTYQGQLKLNDTPVEDPVTLQFDLYDADTLGNLLGTQFIAGVDPVGGLFTVTLNDAGQFGANAFNGEARWLQITVGGTPLTPRQPVTATPYALKVPGIDGYSLDAPGAGPSDAVYVDVSGRVGIGTTSPQTKLHLFDSGVADVRIEGGT